MRKYLYSIPYYHVALHFPNNNFTQVKNVANLFLGVHKKVPLTNGSCVLRPEEVETYFLRVILVKMIIVHYG